MGKFYSKKAENLSFLRDPRVPIHQAAHFKTVAVAERRHVPCIASKPLIEVGDGRLLALLVKITELKELQPLFQVHCVVSRVCKL